MATFLAARGEPVRMRSTRASVTKSMKRISRQIERAAK
jgi:hypothetical protein